MLFPTAQQLNLPACSSHCLFNDERQAGRETVNINFRVIGLTPLGIKPEFTAAERTLLLLARIGCLNKLQLSTFTSTNELLEIHLLEGQSRNFLHKVAN